MRIFLRLYCLTPPFSHSLIAGASEGLGGAYARSLAGRGLNLILIARRRDVLQALAENLKSSFSVEVRTLCLDLSEEESPVIIDRKTAGLDIGLLVYNAALSLIGPFFDHSIDRHLKEIDVNCRGPLTLAYSFGGRFIRRGGGGIILMSSLSSSQGSPYIANYAATKAWNLILAEGLWYEMKDKGVDILACAAGAVDTPNYRQSSPGAKMNAMRPDIVAEQALKDLGRKPVSIPGFGSRAADFIIRRLLPRKARINIMGNVLKKMYGGRRPV